MRKKKRITVIINTDIILFIITIFILFGIFILSK